jgi:hypothetical protein
MVCSSGYAAGRAGCAQLTGAVYAAAVASLVIEIVPPLTARVPLVYTAALAFHPFQLR